MKAQSSVVETLPRSAIRAVMQTTAGKPDIIRLAVGEPSFRTPDHILAAAATGLTAGQTRYTSEFGIPELREAIAGRYSERWGVPVKPGEVFVSAGAVNAIANMTLTLAAEGDEVLVPDPGWPNYLAQIALARASAVRYPLRPENGYLPDFDELDRLVTPRTKLAIANNPSNPTGVVWPAETVHAFAAWAKRHDLWVIADEIYEDLIFDGQMTHLPPLDRERIIGVSGCSKSYAMTGWRLGWSIGPAWLIQRSGLVQEGLVSCASNISQVAAVAALTGPQDVVETMRAAYHQRRDLVRSILEPAGLLPAPPSGAFYALVDLRGTGLPSYDAAMALIEEESVAVAPGSGFGEVAEGFVRISLASSDDDLREGCGRIVRFAARHAASAVPAGVA